MIKKSAAKVGGLLRAVKPVYLLIIALVSLLVCVTALRSNNLTMVQLRSDVYKADKEGGDVQGSLTKLQRFVTSHMNTDLTPGKNSVYPPIQLKYTYERLLAEANKDTNNAQVYSDAQAYCENLNRTDFSGRNRVPCITQYITSHGATPPKSVPDDLYKFDFVSPSWSPDLAGWTAISTVILFVIAIAGFIVRRGKWNEY